ncbi:glutathione reductase [Tripterygium wilfordii]|uniref:glutathione-disulfide reductase n=1 Tax=Tripterygium wilfordii TaxID=458696 RepID=A0A7J7CXR5_TRIWF|nr:glutathione reductase [Tripterygium wilfordii]
MFNLSLIEHKLRLPPHLLSLPLQDAVKSVLEDLFLDKVIANLGLCVSVYDIRDIKGGIIFPGDGASTYTVKFRLLLFRPFVGEIITAKLKEADANGLRLSLGFFDDIYVPVHLLPNPSRFEPDPHNGYQPMWTWEFDGEKLPIDETDEIRFRVHGVNYPSIPLEQPESSKPFAPMVITQRRQFAAVLAESDNGAESARRYDFDLFTIGAGSGGVRASRFASNLGASVAVCELPFSTISSETAGGVGGTCVLRGCVPKKLLVYASKYSHEFDESIGFGWKYDTEPKHDWSTLMANKTAELQRLTGIYKNILKNAGVTLMEGRGKIVDPHIVDVGGKLYSARHILISVAGRPFMPNIPGIEYVAALDLPSRPEKIAIVGGGYIALEFAGIFNGLKSEVHVFIRQKKVLRGFDEEIRDFVAEQMSLRGIEFHTEESPQAVLKSSEGSLSLKTNKGTVEGFSHVMFATGRRPNTKNFSAMHNLGLETVGVKMTENGAIEVVDEYSRTSVPSIWAVGDVTDRVNLTPVALMEGMPPIGQVGLTEEQAIQQYGDIDVYTANFRPLKATLSGLPDRVFMKLIVCAMTDRVLGLLMCGEDSPEIVQGFAVVVKAGLTKADFDATVGIHPTKHQIMRLKLLLEYSADTACCAALSVL